MPIEPSLEYNYSYFPIVFDTEEEMLNVKARLADNDINTRRYFFPSLNKLPYHVGAECLVSEDVSLRVLCLPFYQELELSDVVRIAHIIQESSR